MKFNVKTLYFKYRLKYVDFFPICKNIFTEILERLERGEVKSSSPTAEEMTVDSTTEGGLSPDTTPGEDPDYSSVKSEEHIPPLPDLVIVSSRTSSSHLSLSVPSFIVRPWPVFLFPNPQQNGFWEELNNPNAISAISQVIGIKSKASASQQMEQMMNQSAGMRPASSPRHSVVSSSTSDLQGNYSYSGLPLDNSHQNAAAESTGTNAKRDDEASNGNLLDAQDMPVFPQNTNRTVPALI